MICPDVWTQTAEQGMPWYALMFVHLLRFIPSPWQSGFFQTTALGSRAGVKSLPADFYYTFYDLCYSGFLTPVDVVCEAAEVFEHIQFLPFEVIRIWARGFLIEAQNGFVKDELALWIPVVVREEPPLEISHCAKIRLEAPIRCGNFFGFVDIRVGHNDLALWGAVYDVYVVLIGTRFVWDLPLFCPHTCFQHILPHLIRAVVFFFQLFHGAVAGGDPELGERARHFRKIPKRVTLSAPTSWKNTLMSARHRAVFPRSRSWQSHPLWALCPSPSALSRTFQGMVLPKEAGGPAPGAILQHRLSWLWCQTRRPIGPACDSGQSYTCSLQPFVLFVLGHDGRSCTSWPFNRSIHMSDHNSLESPPPLCVRLCRRRSLQKALPAARYHGSFSWCSSGSRQRSLRTHPGKHGAECRGLRPEWF